MDELAQTSQLPQRTAKAVWQSVGDRLPPPKLPGVEPMGTPLKATAPAPPSMCQCLGQKLGT